MIRQTITSLLLFVAVLPLSALTQNRLVELAGDGAVLLHAPDGAVLVSHNAGASLVPASIVKIPLAQVALTTLGEDFRFETHFYTNESRDLLIRGLGDPFLVSEEIEIITRALARHGFEEVRRIVVDDSAFEPDPDLPLESGADDPYAARNSALAANFNTVNLAWDPAGQLISAEAQTPLTPVARALGARLSRGEPLRINLGDDLQVGLQQVQQLFMHFLQESGITVMDAGYYQASVTDDWTLFYAHRNTRSLTDNLEAMLRYSNNFIANQLFLTLGALKGGYPATGEVARATLRAGLAGLYGAGFGSDSNKLLMIEGSGLARSQRASAEGMMDILEGFKPHATLLPEVDGVLRKSGTLTGVYNYAGYIPGPDGLYPFVILTNQGANNRDEILRILRRQVNQEPR